MKDDIFSKDDVVDLKEDKATDKVIAIRKLVRSLELRYRGYEWDSNGEKFYPTGKVLLGDEIIQKATGLLQPFSEEANLISIKEIKTMARQKYYTCMAFLDSCLVDMGCPDYNYKVAFQMFKNTLQNISDIIMSSRNYMELLYGNKPVEQELDKPITI